MNNDMQSNFKDFRSLKFSSTGRVFIKKTLELERASIRIHLKNKNYVLDEVFEKTFTDAKELN